jgi:hypothetical protein
MTLLTRDLRLSSGIVLTHEMIGSIRWDFPNTALRTSGWSVRPDPADEAITTCFPYERVRDVQPSVQVVVQMVPHLMPLVRPGMIR